MNELARALDRHSTCLYVIGSESGPVKIGVAKNVLKLVRAMQGAGRDVEVLTVARCHYSYGKLVRKALRSERIEPGWFRRSAKVLEAIERIDDGPEALERWLHCHC